MDRVKPVDLTSQEILALVAVFESADQRVNAPGAGLRLVTLAGSDDLADTYADLFDADLDAVASAPDLKCAHSVPKRVPTAVQLG